MKPAVAEHPPVCAVVVTYHPSQAVLDNIAGLSDQFPLVVVVDNGSPANSTAILAALEGVPSHRVIRNSQNLGIAVALNQGLSLAVAEGFSWVATFDQDSTVATGFVEGMFAACEACPARARVAMVSPVIVYPESPRMPDQTAAIPPFSRIRTAMTSGSLIRTDVVATVGRYDESLFMDYVDYDYCLRLQRAGYTMIRANHVRLRHRLGSAETHSFLGRSVTLKSHNAWRRYYITRNRVLMYRRYFMFFPFWCLHDLTWFFIELFKIVCFEQAKLAKLRNVAKGLAHGLTGKTGQLEPPSA